MIDIKYPNLKFRYGNMKKRMLSDICLIILHHTASTSGDANTINNIHLNNGWAGIGYNYVILKDGTVQAGRPLEYIGSHCKGNNKSSIGIVLVGDFRKEKPTEEQLNSMNELIKFLRVKFPQIKRVLNHNDLYATLCPVIDLKGLVK